MQITNIDNLSRNRHTSKKYVTWFLAIGLLAAANGIYWYFLPASQSAASPGKYDFFTVDSAPPDIYSTGIIKSDRSAKISPPVAGIVRRIVSERFSTVKAGSVIIELDDLQSSESLRQETINLETLKIQVRQAQDSLKYLNSAKSKQEQLFESGLVAALTLEEAGANVMKQEYEVKVLEKRVQASEASIEHLMDRMAQTKIRSPIDGIVTDISVTEGQFVAPGGSSDQASTLLVVSDTRELFAQLLVDEIDVSRIRLGQKMELKFDALPRKVASGIINKIAPAPNSSPGKPGVNFEVAVSMQNPIPEVKVGMTVFAVMNDTRSAPRHIPASAIQRDRTQSWVWCVEQNRVHKEMVEIRDLQGDNWILTKGLEAGATIVAGPQDLIRGLAENQLLPASR
jgi:HlyD family secretion protein